MIFRGIGQTITGARQYKEQDYSQSAFDHSLARSYKLAGVHSAKCCSPGKMSPSREFGNVHYRNQSEFAMKISKFSSDGVNILKIVMDFDYTISKEYNEVNEKLPNSFRNFTQCDSIPRSVKDKMYEFYLEYSRYEKISSIAEGIRREKMDEWCRKTSEQFRGLDFVWTDIGKVTEEAKDQLREGTQELFELISLNEIPIFIVSGGQGDCIVSTFQLANIELDDQVHIVSNFVDSQEDGRLNGFKEPMVHALNKQECLTNNSNYQAVANRKNLIVVGDSLLDAKVTGRCAPDENTLAIGFLNKHDENVLRQYLELFDVVIVEDNSMDILTELLKNIIQH